MALCDSMEPGRICVLIVLLVQIASGIEGRELVGADYPVETLELTDAGGRCEHVLIIVQSFLDQVLEQGVGEDFRPLQVGQAECVRVASGDDGLRDVELGVGALFYCHSATLQEEERSAYRRCG